MSGARRWRPMFVLGRLSLLAETDAPMPPLLGSNIGVRTFTACHSYILSVIYHIRISFRLSSNRSMDVPSVDRRIVEGAIHQRITESRIKKSRFQNIQKNIAGRSTASQLACSSIGARSSHYLDTSNPLLDLAALANILGVIARYIRTAPLL